jgi:hypothetical protein
VISQVRSIRFRAVFAATVAAITVGMSGSAAHADATSDALGAVLGTTLDQVGDLGGVALTTNPNIACKVEAYGTAITQHVPAVVGETYGSDVASGRLTCVSFETMVYSATLTVRLQYLIPGTSTYANISTCAIATARGATTNGVLEIPLTLTPICTYMTGNPYLNRYHRGYASATTNFGTAGPQPTTGSPSTWFMQP